MKEKIFGATLFNAIIFGAVIALKSMPPYLAYACAFVYPILPIFRGIGQALKG